MTPSSVVPPRDIWVQRGDSGPVVIDLRRRLRELGFEAPSESSSFDEPTEHALRAFQDSRGLEPDGRCGPQTWSALSEASHTLGSRLLCLTRPMMRGDDVSELQLRLGALGFDAGRTDGIFGPLTSRAVEEFQRNVGIVTDSVCGPDTVSHLRRMASRGSITSIAGLREHEETRRLPSLDGVRVAVVHLTDLETIAARAGAELAGLGAAVAVLRADDWSDAAVKVNEYGAAVALAISVIDDPCCELTFYETEGFHSFGGERLANEIARRLPGHPGRPAPVVQGRRLTIARETRCPTVRWRVGTGSSVEETLGELAAAIARAVEGWVTADDTGRPG